MKKLLYPLAFTLTAFLILYSCSAEEEDTTPPPSIVQNQQSQDDNQTSNQSTNSFGVGVNLDSGGGRLNIESSDYDEGTVIEVNAIPLEGYYFIGWENLSVNSINTDGSEVWGNHSTWGSFEQTISITVDRRMNLFPKFLRKSEINDNLAWSRQGFTTTNYSIFSDLISDFDYLKYFVVNEALINLIESGSNSIILDYTLLQNDGPNGNSFSYERRQNPYFFESGVGNIIPIAKMANRLGLNISLKPILQTEASDWSVVEPSNPEAFFRSYFDNLIEIINIVISNELIIDKFYLTNELISLTTNHNYIPYWLDGISRIREITDLKLGFNVRAFNTPYISDRFCDYEPNYVQEYKQVPSEVYSQLDFVGLSIYQAQYFSQNKNDNDILSETVFKNYWSNSPYVALDFSNNECGDCLNQNCQYTFGRNSAEELNSFISSVGKEVLVSEFGATPYKNLQHPNWNGDLIDISYDLELQKDYFSATLDFFKNKVNGLSGVHGYYFPLEPNYEEIEIELGDKQLMFDNETYNQQIRGSSPNRNEWNIYDKPALEAFRQYYGGQ